MKIIIFLLLFTSLAVARPSLSEIASDPHLYVLYMGGTKKNYKAEGYALRIAELNQWYGSESQFQRLPVSDFEDPCKWEYGEIFRLMKLGLKTNDPAESARISRLLKDLIATVKIKHSENAEVERLEKVK